MGSDTVDPTPRPDGHASSQSPRRFLGSEDANTVAAYVWLTAALPETLLAQCDRAAVVDREVLADCETIVKRVAQPLLAAIELGLPKEAAAVGMAGEDLRRYLAQVDALAHVRHLLDELGTYENDADTVARALLDRVHTARAYNDTELANNLDDLANDNRDRLPGAREELAIREQALAALPDPDSLPNGTDQMLARYERESAQIMLDFARAELASLTKIEDLMRSVVSNNAEASAHLTALFDHGWRTLLEESVARRRVRHRLENRRRLWRRVRWLLALVLSVVVGLGVAAATESWASGGVSSAGVAFGLGIFEHFVLDPLMARRVFDTDARALTEEVVVTARFWVVMRTRQAFLNEYARGHLEAGLERADLVPPLLKSPRPA